MDRLVKVNNIITDNLSKPNKISIEFENSSIIELCLELFLLKEGLTNNFIIVEKSKGFKLPISIGKNLHPNTRAIANFSSNKVELQITKNELDYWINYFMKYYRDGIADVDHIDVETSTSELYVVFKVSKFIPPVSEEEALKRLGL